MTRAEVEAILLRVKYKPDVRIELEPHIDMGWTDDLDGAIALLERNARISFRVTYRVPDVRNPRRPITVIHPASLPPMHVMSTPRDVLFFVREALLDAERHELGEWLELDGVRPFDPHAGRG